MARKQYIVTFEPSADPDTVASELRASGLEVDNIMRDIGIISGSADDGQAEKLRRVRTVLDLSESEPVQIPPPDSNVQ